MGGFYKTPLIEITSLGFENGNRVFAKCENHNELSKSHYDRVFKHLFDRLIAEKKIVPGKTHLFETSSGNAGTAFANYCALYGFSGTVVFPKNVRQSRLDTVAGNKNVSVCVSSSDEFMLGARRTLSNCMHDLRLDDASAFFINHSQTWESVVALRDIGRELAGQFREIGIAPNVFVSALGNGTSTTGIGLELKDYFPSINIVGFEPENAPTFTSQKSGKLLRHGKEHCLTGTGVWGIRFPNFIPGLVSDIRLVKNDLETHSAWKTIAKQVHDDLKGESIGYTSAESILIAKEISREVHKKNLLLVFYDVAEFYQHN